MLKLKIYSSSSKGNCYELSNNDNSLLLDCGYKQIEHKFNNVKGILLTHIHQDHIGAIPKIKSVYKGCYYANEQVLDILPVLDVYKKKINEYEPFEIENFKILPFSVRHDCLNYNYLIKDSESGLKILYLTDLANINDFQFKDVDIFICESNYDEDVVDYEDLKTQRLIETHSSLQETTQFLLDNININTKKIFLIHLSRSNENYLYFEEYVKERINNENIEVIALNPKCIVPLEYELQESIDIDFD